MPEGDTIRVGEGGSHSGQFKGDVIDVEVRDVR